MCRLFAMNAGEHAATASFWLLDAPDSLTVQSHREPDGTGLGWFDDEDRPHVSKQPIAAYEDRAFAHSAHDLRSRTFVSHIRFASTGSLHRRNTHPFEQRGRLFAHNGVIEDLPALEAHLGEDLALVKGDTDSERFFALITREVQAREGDVEEGIIAACRWIAAQLPVFAINFVLATPGRVWALRYPLTHELYVLQRPPGEALEHRSSLGSHITSAHGADHPLVVIASERMNGDEDWVEITSGELVSVAPDLHVTRREILGDPPAHLLTLADLDERAKASQAKVPSA
ncbi:MAG TPA: class II glutamine amidotransferase [Solirubrobacteraceae bacterium]|jgi:glutamine amidotransferase|nr:class II glutamine amidotransferase [Solirubrobacteraceae bacterium]